MEINISPLMIVSALAIGVLSACMAYKRGRNPYLWFTVGLLFGLLGIFAIFFAANRKKPEVKLPAPVPVIEGPKDKFWYYLDPASQRQGPLSHDALTAAWKAGKLDPATYVWHEEMSDWKPLQETLSMKL